jgi:hypothetical protein
MRALLSGYSTQRLMYVPLAALRSVVVSDESTVGLWKLASKFIDFTMLAVFDLLIVCANVASRLDCLSTD